MLDSSELFTLIIASSFGEVINSTTYISLTEDSILITNTTLYCVAEDKTSPQVVWSYLHPSGTRSNLTATTNDVTTGISTLYVYSNSPGYYSCEVTTEEGTVVTHTVRMLDITLYTGVYISSSCVNFPDYSIITPFMNTGGSK